jgi:hypothetical protein
MAKKLNAWIRKNPLTPDPNDYVAVPVTVGSIQIEGIVDELEKEGMELKRETVIDVVNRFNRKAAEMLVSGYNVNTGLVYMRPIIKGVFYGKTWNPETNSLVPSITPGMDLRTAIGDTNVEILGEQSNPLEILSLTDTFTGKTDGTLTKGRNAEIRGSYLKIAGEDPACGVAFTNTATAETTRLDMADIVINEPSRLLILVPASLAAGEYELSLTTQFSTGSTLLKQPRSTTFGVPVVIA